MRFEIPFNEALSRKHAKLIFDLHWKELLKKNNKSIFYIVLTILFGVLVVYGNNNIGFIFIALGIHFLMNWINFRSHYNKNKRIYFKAVDNHLNSYVLNNPICIWEFSEDSFLYSDFKFDLRMKWNVLKGFKIVDDAIFFEIKDSIAANFILEKEEVEDEHFEKIKNFIESKIKRDGIL